MRFRPTTPFPILACLVFAMVLAAALRAFGQPTNLPALVSYTVNVNSNGAITAPTNFFTANSALWAQAITNQGIVARVGTMAELDVLLPGFDGQLVAVARYSTNAAWGRIRHWRYSAASAAPTNYAVRATASGTGRWILDEADPNGVDLRVTGAIPSDGVDDLAKIQAAVDHMFDQGGGWVYIPAGEWEISGSIQLKHKVSLVGNPDQRWADIHSTVPTNQWYRAAGSSVIRLMDGANAPMIIMASTTGQVKQPAEVWEDGSIYDSIEQNSTVRDVVLAGNNIGQTVMNADGIFARAKWNFKIENVHITGCNGYAIRLLDCNVANIVGGSCMSQSDRGRGVFLYGCADTTIRGTSLGGFHGPIVWLDGLTCFKNVFADGFWYNPWRTNSSWTVTAATNGTFTSSPAHLLETGDPVVFNVSGGSLPPEIQATNTYWAIRLTTNTFKVNPKYQAALTNGSITLSGTGSGTITASVGPASGIFLHNKAANNTFVNIRMDQSGDDGITLHDADNNTFVACQAAEAGGTANGEPYLDKAGVRIVDGDFNRFVGMLFYGVPFPQAWGVYIEAGSNNEFIAPTYNSMSIANVVDVPGTNLRNLSGYLVETGSPAITLGGTNLGTVLNLVGNNGGPRALTLARPSLADAKFGIGVGTDTLVIQNEARTNLAGTLVASPSTITLGFGGSGGTPRPSSIEAEDSSGTDIAGGALTIAAGQGTGNAAPPAISFQTPVPGGSGSSQQSLSTRFQVSQPASPSSSDSAAVIYFYDGAAWQSRRVVLGANDSGGSGFRALRVVN